MANYTTSADLIDDVLFRAGENTDGTSDFDSAAIRYINRAYQAIWRGGGELLPGVSEQWWWMHQYGNGILTLLPVFDDGTVSVTNNSTTVTFSSAPQRNASNISVQGFHFKVDDHADVFRISSHTSGVAAATLDSVYTGETDTTASFKAFKLDYTLASDVLAITGPMRAFQGSLSNNTIEQVPENVLREKWPLESAGAGVPQNYAKIGLSSSTHVVRFSHYGGVSDTELMRIDYDYIYQPSDLADNSSEPLVPREYRKVLADWALFFLLQDKEDSRAGDVFKIAAQGLQQMALENRRGQTRSGIMGGIFPRQGRRMRDTRGPLRTENGFLITG